MKVVLFCGGLGTRIREYSEAVPKPMIPVGYQPVLWHVMNYYSSFGHKEFILCLGYKANIIKDFFLNYRPQAFADCVVSGFGGDVEFLGEPEEDWRVSSSIQEFGGASANACGPFATTCKTTRCSLPTTATA